MANLDQNPDAQAGSADLIERRGLMLVLSSPSGAGKSTIARNLLAKEPDLELSVSLTTRPKRDSEIDGTHYHFVGQKEFERQVNSDALIEYAQVHGNYYGTPRDPVEAALARGKDVLFDIDWQGAEQVMSKARGDAVSIFILPPSMSELQSRLVRRAEDSEEVIARRLKNALEEIPHWKDYDYVLVNDDLQHAFAQVRAILHAERKRRDRQPGIVSFVDALLNASS